MDDYIVTKTTWIGGRLRQPGDVVPLTAAQAKYEHVRPAKPAKPAGKGAAS